MADVRLRSVKFPGLTDKYVVKDYDDDIETISEDLEEAQTALETKAEIDGYYDEMAVGSAEQLISTVTVEDKVPYLFRTAGGSADIGNRETDTIIGGTVAWNQKIQNGNFDPGASYWYYTNATINVSAKVATVTPSASNSSISTNVNMIKGHKYFRHAEMKGTANGYAYIAWYGALKLNVLFNGSWQIVSDIINNTYDDNASWKFQVGADQRTDLEPYYVRNVMCIDLTAMFGTTIADYIYSLEQSTAGAGVAFFRKLFPKPYYAYDVGTLKHVEELASHDTTGFNQWDEEWEAIQINSDGTTSTATSRIGSKNYIPVLPNTTYCMSWGKNTAAGRGAFYDADKNLISYSADFPAVTVLSKDGRYYNTFTTPSGACYLKFCTNTAYGVTYLDDICINLSWDGERNGEYEAYVKHSYPLDDSLVLRGLMKLDANNQPYYYGDTYESDGTVKRYFGVVDLGTLTWGYSESYLRFNANLPVENAGASYTRLNWICHKYATSLTGWSDTDRTDKIITVGGRQVLIRDSAYTSYSDLKTALSGVYLVYELATPTEETAEPYTNPQIVDDFGTEEYVSTSIVPVGHETYYMNNLRAKLEMAPASPDSEGDYIVRHENGENSYVPLIIPSELPDAPGSDGTYVLKVTVASGEATYSWEEET